MKEEMIRKAGIVRARSENEMKTEVENVSPTTENGKQRFKKRSNTLAKQQANSEH